MRRRGFTLVELMIVVTIIGILIAFILKAYTGSIRVAEKSATVALISKLEAALVDRMDALASQQADVNWCHYWLAGIWMAPPSPTHLAPDMPSNQRAQVIANFDRIRAEMPDVFVVEADPDYPLNFAATRFNPLGGSATGTLADYVLPLGGGIADPAGLLPASPVTGMKGASFAAAGAVYKQLGYGQQGYDGADNNNNGLIDERVEGEIGLQADEKAQITTRLANHKHKTARAEVLYAILVEGSGPFGSSFSRDDFNKQEVQDTDGDGLMEFVDAYGEPLQFFRWPILYRSEAQKGFPDLAKITQDVANSAPVGPYTTVYESRDQDPLDPNQLLQNPGWSMSTATTTVLVNSAYPWGTPRGQFAKMFHILVDPLALTSGTTGGSSTNTTINTYWDRSTDATKGYYMRRAYYSRPLVLSGGPDKQPGVARLSSASEPVAYQMNYQTLDERSSFPLANGTFASTRDTTGAPVALSVAGVIQIENQAGRIDPNRNASGAPLLTAGRNDTNTLLEEFGNDDISNQNLHAAGGPLTATGR